MTHNHGRPVRDVIPPAMIQRDVGAGSTLHFAVPSTPAPSASPVGHRHAADGQDALENDAEEEKSADMDDVNVWFTAPCTSAAIHYDTSHNFHLVLYGTKVILGIAACILRACVRACERACVLCVSPCNVAPHAMWLLNLYLYSILT